MKNFILKAVPVFGIAFLFAGDANAQSSIEIRDAYNGNVVTNDTINFWVDLGDSHQYDFDYYNVGSSAVTYKMTKTNIQLQTGASSWFCLYHNNDPSDPQSQCYIPSVTNSGNFVTDPGEFNTLLADFSAGTTNTGTSIVRYKWYDINNPGDSALLILVYNVTPVGINENNAGGSLGEPYPNPANTSVTIPFNLSERATATLMVTDALGREVYQQSLTTATVQLNTGDWAEGIYFVVMMDENGILARKKLMVR